MVIEHSTDGCIYFEDTLITNFVSKRLSEKTNQAPGFFLVYLKFVTDFYLRTIFQKNRKLFF